jgi:hypothetical protein
MLIVMFLWHCEEGEPEESILALDVSAHSYTSLDFVRCCAEARVGPLEVICHAYRFLATSSSWDVQMPADPGDLRLCHSHAGPLTAPLVRAASSLPLSSAVDS